jgi:hypothetical protein
MKGRWWVSWIWGGVGMMMVLLCLGGGCGWVGKQLISDLLIGDLEKASFSYKAAKWCAGGLPLTAQWDRLIADKTYIVLLQNNYELRATGGFAGSYVRIKMTPAGMKDMFVQDIYVPDGKLPGHVEPPYPVQEAFGQGWWKLRDANWAIDFPRATADIAWFMEQGGERPVDGVIAVNMSLFKKWLEITGPVEVTTYGQKVTANNFYNLAQSEAETDFVPGTTAKRDFLGATGTVMMEKLKDMKFIELIKLTKLIKEQMDSGEIMIWTKEIEIEKEIEKNKWDGGLGLKPSAYDYIYMVESNLGANKANCCIERNMRYEIGDKTKLTVEWKNNNEFSGPKPPVFWGGDYVNYVRIINPSMPNPPVGRAGIQSIMVNGKELRPSTKEDFQIPNSLRSGIDWDMYNVEDYGDYQIIGFWVLVRAKSSANAEVNYEIRDMNKVDDNYRLIVRKQPGVEPYKFILTVDGKEKINDLIDREKKYIVN